MNKVLVITGGAKRIGAQICRTFHAKGFDIALHYRNSKDAAQALADELNQSRENSVRLFQADLNNTDSIIAMAKNIETQFCNIDVLINNASSFYPTAMGSITIDTWDDLFNSNVKGAFFLSQALIPKLKEQQGSIINIVDIHSEKPLKEHPVYNMAKAALNMMTKTLAKELGPEIRVNGVSPGAILWPEHESDDTQKQQSILERIPLKKAGQPQDIANAALFLAEQDYISGQIINIDGGRSLNM